VAYLYRHIRLDRYEPFYIGIGKEKSRCFEKVKRNKFWFNIVAKTDYKVEILFDNLSWEDACKKEMEFIKLYGRKDLGTGTLCNLTIGGDGILGVVRTEEYREKLRQVNTGKKMSENSVQKLKEALKGRRHSEETKLKMGKTRKGRKLSEAHKANISQGNLGKSKSESHRENIKRSRICVPVLQYHLDGTFIKEWDCQRDVERTLGIARTGITRCLNNICRQAGGFVWKQKNINVIA
jgi:hypothetical protein